MLLLSRRNLFDSLHARFQFRASGRSRRLLDDIRRRIDESTAATFRRPFSRGSARGDEDAVCQQEHSRSQGSLARDLSRSSVLSRFSFLYALEYIRALLFYKLCSSFLGLARKRNPVGDMFLSALHRSIHREARRSDAGK